MIPPRPLVKHTRKWSKPPSGSFKLNTDASVWAGCGFMGLGGVVHDSEGMVIASRALRRDAGWSADVAELMAIKEGLLLVNKLGLCVKFVESDAFVVVRETNVASPFLLVLVLLRMLNDYSFQIR